MAFWGRGGARGRACGAWGRWCGVAKPVRESTVTGSPKRERRRPDQHQGRRSPRAGRRATRWLTSGPAPRPRRSHRRNVTEPARPAAHEPATEQPVRRRLSFRTGRGHPPGRSEPGHHTAPPAQRADPAQRPRGGHRPAARELGMEPLLRRRPSFRTGRRCGSRGYGVHAATLRKRLARPDGPDDALDCNGSAGQDSPLISYQCHAEVAETVRRLVGTSKRSCQGHSSVIWEHDLRTDSLESRSGQHIP